MPKFSFVIEMVPVDVKVYQINFFSLEYRLQVYNLHRLEIFYFFQSTGKKKSGMIAINFLFILFYTFES